MNDFPVDKTQNEPDTKLKVFKNMRPISGAAIGIFLFLLITLPAKFISINSAPVGLLMITICLESWGRLIVSKVSILTSTNIPVIAFYIATSFISILPVAIIGFMIGSNKKSTNIKGIISLIIYFCMTLLGGLLVIYLAD